MSGAGGTIPDSRRAGGAGAERPDPLGQEPI
jgi:hypothetical protein